MMIDIALNPVRSRGSIPRHMIFDTPAVAMNPERARDLWPKSESVRALVCTMPVSISNQYGRTVCDCGYDTGEW
jgi:hypothetical protein